MKNGKVTEQRSELLSLRLEKFKTASVELPKSINISSSEGKMLGLLYTSNNERSSNNSLVLHLFNLHIHIPFPKFVKPVKWPVYREDLNDTSVGLRKRRWRHIYIIKTYGFGYHFYEKSLYFLYGTQPGNETAFGKNKIKVWTPFGKDE